MRKNKIMQLRQHSTSLVQVLRSVTSISMSIVIMVTAASMSSCSSGKNKRVQTADEVVKNSYASEEITLPEDIAYVADFQYVQQADTAYIIGTDSEAHPIVYRTGSNFSDFTKLDLEINTKIDTIQTYTVKQDGSLILLVNSISYGDFKVPDFDSPDFDSEKFDWNAYDEARTSSYKLNVYDKTGKLSSSSDCNEIFGITGKQGNDQNYLSVYQIINIGENNIAFYSDSSNNKGQMIFNENGKKVKDIAKILDNSDIDSAALTSDKKIAVTYYPQSQSEVSLAIIDPDTFQPTEKDIKLLNSNMGIGKISTGTGNYSTYILQTDALYGYNSKTKSVDEVINWLDSDIEGNNVSTVLSLNDGSFIACATSESGESSNIYRLSKKASSEMSKTKVITIAGCDIDQKISSAVSEYNKKSKSYRIRINDYTQYNTEKNQYSGSIEKLKNDFMSGKSSDIILSNSFNGGLNALESKGSFADLYDIMKKDDTVKKDSFLPNVLKAFEYKGKLYELPVSFSVNTISGKKKFVGNKENWTLEEMMKDYKAMPSGTEFTSNSNAENLFSTFVNYNIGNYVDFNKKSCNFDTPEFKELLDFCKSFGKDKRDWQNMTEEDWQKYSIDQAMASRNDKRFIEIASYSSFRDYHNAVAGIYNNEPITLAGYPSPNGNGGNISVSNLKFSIAADSPVKSAAWDFVKQFFTEEYQSSSDNDFEFPVNLKSFEAKADEAMKPQSYTDPDTGEVTTYPSTYEIGDKSVEIGDLTQSERDYIVQYIENITTVEVSDSKLVDIVTEETDGFFNGNKTADETAKMLQNRISIYVSEQS